MIKFFQILFFTAGVWSLILQVMEFNKWKEANKEGSVKPYPVRWFNFILQTLVALGCVLSILLYWIG